MSWLISIIIMLIMLAVLVSIHEAGHLIAAKIFHVYCFEYSIGFGPKILKVKRKKGETYFSIRCIPLGGYVSMYGEAEAIPEGYEAPPIERSLEHINRGKKAVVLLAGVTMNFLLGLVLIFISCSCFPQYYTFEYRGFYKTSYVDDEGENLSISNFALPGEYSDSFWERLRGVESQNSDYVGEDYYVLATLLENEEGESICYLLSDSVVLVNEDGEIYNNGTYVAIYYPSELVDGHSLRDAIRLYPAIIDGAEEPYTAQFSNWIDEEAITNNDYLSINSNLDGYSFELNLSLVPKTNQSFSDENTFTDFYDYYKIDVAANFSIENGELVGDDVFIPAISQYLGWSNSWSLWAQRVPSATTAIINGLGQLFTGHLENLSSVVGMTAAIPSIISTGGAAYLFYYAGLISINLAIFNLLPFPPLDGWGLLVTIIEAISRKKVPDKLKTIFSIAGYVLIFALLIFVVIKDVISLV